MRAHEIIEPADIYEVSTGRGGPLRRRRKGLATKKTERPRGGLRATSGVEMMNQHSDNNTFRKHSKIALEGLCAGCATHVSELWAERDKPVFRCELCAVLTETIDGVFCSGTA